MPEKLKTPKTLNNASDTVNQFFTVKPLKQRIKYTPVIVPTRKRMITRTMIMRMRDALVKIYRNRKKIPRLPEKENVGFQLCMKLRPKERSFSSSMVI